MVPPAGNLPRDIAGDEGKVQVSVGEDLEFIDGSGGGEREKVVFLRGRFPIMVFNGLRSVNGGSVKSEIMEVP